MANGEFDVIVIGSGPGGYVGAIRAAQLGLRTAVVERDPGGCGGTCLLRGCIPTKALLHTADLYSEMKKARDYGIVAENLSLDFAAVQSRKSRVVTRLSKGIETYLFKKNKITLFKGHGRLEGARTVVVKGEGGEQKLTARSVVLATGSKVRPLPGIAVDGTSIVTSDEILELKQVPRSLVVIGAGAVGIEFASIYARFGSTVTVIELLPRVLPLEDEEISAEARKILAKQMTIHTGAKTEAALKTAQGVEVAFRTSDGEARSITAEMLLVAVGRAPVTDGLNLESTRAQLEKGYVRVNATMETDEPGLFAIGDVATVDGKPHPMLAHVASHECIGVAERLAGKATEPLNYDRVPSATYSDPEVASVGLSEAEAKKRGYDVRVGRFPFGNIAKPRIIGHDAGLVKVVADAKYDEVLGVHMVGPHATDLIAEACVALRLESTTEEITRTIHAHPTLPEALMQAAEAVYGHAID
ncbi:MAG TPA: dihydrolipoyl dehydrogenase, partial [Vicinamibacteria bacterium]|nr:dihydrolipoyl dehydrogenase [Vicinamibacteria bacterium]